MSLLCENLRCSPPLVDSFQSPLFGKSSTSIILSALAVFDAGVIYTGLVRYWIRSTFSVDIRLMSSIGCKIHFHLTYLFRQVAHFSPALRHNFSTE